MRSSSLDEHRYRYTVIRLRGSGRCFSQNNIGLIVAVTENCDIRYNANISISIFQIYILIYLQTFIFIYLQTFILICAKLYFLRIHIT